MGCSQSPLRQRHPLLPLMLFAALSGAERMETRQAGIRTLNLASPLPSMKSILPKLIFSPFDLFLLFFFFLHLIAALWVCWFIKHTKDSGLAALRHIGQNALKHLKSELISTYLIHKCCASSEQHVRDFNSSLQIWSVLVCWSEKRRVWSPPSSISPLRKDFTARGAKSAGSALAMRELMLMTFTCSCDAWMA